MTAIDAGVHLGGGGGGGGAQGAFVPLKLANLDHLEDFASS